MDVASLKSLADCWSAAAVATNAVIFFDTLGALALGLIVGYERTYQGRAAGMRTYGLVCMASAAVTATLSASALWHGGHGATALVPDASHAVQGILTGIGFLGAGVIMREGLSIRGLTTAASIWSSSAIGILVGVGFYPAAILLTLLSTVCMTWVHRVEQWLPSRSGVDIVVRFKKDFHPREAELRRVALEHGYEIAKGSLSIAFEAGHAEWHYVAVAKDSKEGTSVCDLARMMSAHDGVERFQLNHCRH